MRSCRSSTPGPSVAGCAPAVAQPRPTVGAFEQVYRCKQCGRTYNALSTSPLAHLKRKDVWLKYIEAMKQGLSVRKAADVADIHMTTAFRWRHRMFIAPSQRKGREMDGIVEADETYFLESYKGSRRMPRESR